MGETGRSVVILGSGPNRIGQGIEFDYCCVHAARSFRELGLEAVMVNCNPETVSTDYDTSDRLYFEPLGVEEVLAICEREQPEGVVIQFGGQTPLKLARELEHAGYRILGTPYEAIDLAEDRERFGALLERLGIRCPEWGIVEDEEEAIAVAERVGYPVLVRPSYVLGGRAMRVCYGPDDVRAAMAHATGRVLVDRFLENAVEIDVDALCDGEDTYVAAVMQHVEEAGVHSGDSSCVLPPPSLTAAWTAEIHAIVGELGPALGVVGLLNVQLAVADGARLRARGQSARLPHRPVREQGDRNQPRRGRLPPGRRRQAVGAGSCRRARPGDVSVKAAVLPFARFPGSDAVLGPEMRSTGEVMATAADFPTAFAKAERAAGRPLPTEGTVFLSVRDADKPAAVPVAAALVGPRLPPARDRRDGPGARCRRTGGRAGAQGLRAGRRRHGRRPDPPRTLRPRRQHSAGLRRPQRRLPDPRGRARRPRPVHHDALGRAGRDPRDRERAQRGRIAQDAAEARGTASGP